jgi:hypothetical protein
MITDTIDVKESCLRGKDLRDFIDQIVDSTQEFIVKPLPDRLIVTRKQFKMLKPNLVYLGVGEEYYYKSPYSIMEITIK